MWFDDQTGWLIAFLALLLAIGLYVQRTDSRVRLMKLRLDRLSLTFLKIENDLSAIQDCLLVMSRDGEQAFDLVAKIRDRRTSILRHIVEQGPSSAEVLRGLEFPDFAEDPVFWANDRMRRLGLNEDDSAADKVDPT